MILKSVDGGSITAYDAVGNPVNVQFRWAQVTSSSSGSTWQLFYQNDSSATGSTASWTNVGSTFTFNANGEMSPQITSLTIPGLTVNGDDLGNVQLQIGTDGLTQFASTSGTVQVNNLQQNGYAAGSLQSVSVDSQNRVVGNFTNGQTIPLAEVTLASFNGTNSCRRSMAAPMPRRRNPARRTTPRPAASRAVHSKPRTSISPPSSAS